MMLLCKYTTTATPTTYKVLLYPTPFFRVVGWRETAKIGASANYTKAYVWMQHNIDNEIPYSFSFLFFNNKVHNK